MSKKQKPVEKATSLEHDALQRMCAVMAAVALEEIDMATGREQMREWWELLTVDQKEEIAASLFEKIDRMRKISDAIHQEFASFSAAFRK